jgi:hypothetical protein
MLKMSEPEEGRSCFSIHTFADERPTVVVNPSVRRLLYLYAFRKLAANRRAIFWDKGSTYSVSAV